ncbi:hypothetical protein [Planctomicrobium sp. SH527]|uniref:hypothetical protein n=1 Tax=Planctomicrobium sp. SH527 TaxID=3448123 RepID=UPI003F5BFEC4
MPVWHVNGVELFLMGVCGYDNQEQFECNEPGSTGIALFQRSEGDDIRDYIRVQSYGKWDDDLEDAPFHEEWFEVKGPNLVKVNPEKGFRPVK